ncbi:MAG: calcium-binding protein [Pirellulales bacterium]
MFRKLFSNGKKKETNAKSLRQRLSRQRLGAERLEERCNFAALLAGLDIYGNLLVEDALPAMNTNNDVTIVRNGANVEISDPAGVMLSGIGGTQVNANTVSVPFAGITGKVLVNTYGGNDDLTVDFSNGVPFTGTGLWYDGGVGTTDSLAVVDFTGNDVVATYVSSTQTLTPQQGTLSFDGSVINYKAIEPIDIDGVYQTMTLNLPGKGDLAVLSGTGGGDLQIASTAVGPRFETTVFADPTNVVTINLGADNANFVAQASAEANLGTAGLFVNGQDGNDVINISAFTTTGVAINGGNGADTVHGGAGPDNILGGGGNDLLNGNDSNDFIDGGSDADTINGGNGGDILVGGLGGDILSGGAGNDDLDGGDGNDRLNGDADVDVLDGGAGADRIEVLGVEGSTDTVTGGASTDDLVLLSNVTLAGFNAAASSIERVVTNGFTIFGTGVVDTFTFAAVQPIGAFTVNGLGGNDTITGTPYNDTLIGDTGADSIDGGNGADVITGNAGDDTINGGLGNDTITGGLDVDTIDGGSGNDVINVSGNDSETDTIQGGANTDTIVNTAGPAAITLNGFDAATNGIERINGAGGVIQGNGNDNVFNFQISASATVVFTSVPSINGLAGNDTITGTNAADVIFGGDGDDVLNGLAGNDTLWGENDEDTLDGGSGTDELFGGDGVDQLTGGANLDYFNFQNTAADLLEEDVITDFNGDRIRYIGYLGASYATLVVSVPGGGPNTLITEFVTGKPIQLANLVKTKPQLPSSLFLFV